MRAGSFHYIPFHPLEIVPAVFILELALRIHADDFLDGILDGLFRPEAGGQQPVGIDSVAARVVGRRHHDISLDVLGDHIGDVEDRDVLEAGIIDTCVLRMIEQEQIKIGDVVDVNVGAGLVADQQGVNASIIDTISTTKADLNDKIDSPAALRYKGVTITPGGFVAFEGVWRERSVNS